MTSDEKKAEEGTRQVAKENKREIRSGTRGKTVSDYDTFRDRVDPDEIVAATDFTKPKRRRTRFDPERVRPFGLERAADSKAKFSSSPNRR